MRRRAIFTLSFPSSSIRQDDVEKVFIRDEFIKLGQALKLCGETGSGVEAKYLITDGKVLVNGEVCMQRGKKLVPGDHFQVNQHDYQIHRAT